MLFKAVLLAILQVGAHAGSHGNTCDTEKPPALSTLFASGFSSTACSGGFKAHTTKAYTAGNLYPMCMPDFTIKCPAKNGDDTEVPFVTATGKPLKCKTCGSPTAQADGDLRQGKYKTLLEFGNNLLSGGTYDDSFISGYDIHIVDADDNVVADTSTTVASVAGTFTCCNPKMYKVLLAGDWPAEGKKFMVVPFAGDGAAKIRLARGTGVSGAFSDVAQAGKSVEQSYALGGMTSDDANYMKDNDAVTIAGVVAATNKALTSGSVTAAMYSIPAASKKVEAESRRLEAVGKERRLQTKYSYAFKTLASLPTTLADAVTAATIVGDELKAGVVAAAAASGKTVVVGSATAQTPVVVSEIAAPTAAPTAPPPTPPPTPAPTPAPTPPPTPAPTPPPTPPPTTTCVPVLCLAPTTVTMTTTNNTITTTITTTNTTLAPVATMAPVTTTNTTTLTTVTTTNTTSRTTTTTNTSTTPTTATTTNTSTTTTTTATTTTVNGTTTTTNTTLAPPGATMAPTATTTNITTFTTVTTTNVTTVTVVGATTTNTTTTTSTGTTRDPCACFTTTAATRRLQPTKMPRRLAAHETCSKSCPGLPGMPSGHVCGKTLASGNTSTCSMGAPTAPEDPVTGKAHPAAGGLFSSIAVIGFALSGFFL